MPVFGRRQRRIAGVVAVVLIVALLGGIAYAAIPDANGVIHGCYKDVSGNLRVVDSATSCLPSETAISWNQSGQQGPPGLSGYEQKSHQVFLNPNEFAEVSVDCSAGKKVLGGGFDIETPTDVKVFSSEPAVGGNLSDHSWSVLAQNTGTVGPRQVTVTAICAFAG
jgi:hypothetical protein